MIAAVGAFDGFHRGHRALLDRAAARASENGASWGVVTFTRHPDRLFCGAERALNAESFKSLFSPLEQRTLEQFFSIPDVRRINFTRTIARMSPEEFLDYISDRFSVDGIVVGEDFRFAKDRSGTPEYLAGACAARGWSLDVVPLLHGTDGVAISSTVIRAAASSGEMRCAWELLGYPFFCASRVIRGNSRGAALGFPTANVEIDPDKIILRGGVYAALVCCEGSWFAGAVNIGFNPTFGDVTERRFEINLIGYEGDIYGHGIAVFLLDHIRDEVRFDSPDDLKAQIAKDTVTIRSVSFEVLESHRSLWEKFAAIL
ncbi:MAG: riboflavin biosynthesis protein RibF [Synergistaceae bacterium]|jgi:riboflavin kinase/FMN adenylyltransferase|nr:riboflavin biosynthesis protein RibF [Synergistaceae bacterium]